MKSIVTSLIITLVFVSVALAHGYPTAEEFQMFPESVLAQPVATIGGVAVAIPFAVVGAVGGIVAAPFLRNDIKGTVIAGAFFTGFCGYMAGQQIGWPVYGIEKGIGWCFK